MSPELKVDMLAKYIQQEENTQHTFLLRIIDISVKHRRYGKCEDPDESCRQYTLTFMIPDGRGGHIQVRKSTFMDIYFPYSRRKEIMAKKKKADKRGWTNSLMRTSL